MAKTSNFPINFLHRRMKACKSISEKEKILDIIIQENQRIKKRKNIDELMVAQLILKEIYEKYYE